MGAVKEAVLEQKIDDLTLRFDGFESRCERAEERNHREHREIREEIGAVRSEMNDGFRDLRAVMNEGFGELRATITGLQPDLGRRFRLLPRHRGRRRSRRGRREVALNPLRR